MIYLGVPLKQLKPNGLEPTISINLSLSLLFLSMWNSTFTCAQRTVADFGMVCFSSSCCVQESILFGWVISAKIHQTNFVAIIFVISKKELIGRIWGLVLCNYCSHDSRLLVNFSSQCLPLDICLNLNHVSLYLYVPCVVVLYFYFYTPSIIDHTHT